MKISGIYSITSPSGKRYIGSSCDIAKRHYSHRYALKKGNHHCYLLQRAADKYGYENLRHEVLFTCPRESLLRYEQWYINNYMPEYNTTKFAASPTQDPAIAAKQAEKLRGRKLSPEQCLIRSINGKGRPKSAETRRRLSISMTGKKKTPETVAKMTEINRKNAKRGENSPLFGKPGNRTGSVNSEEHRLAISLALKGRKFPERSGGSNVSAVRIECLETGIVYDCIKDAMEWLKSMGSKAYTSSIRSCCLGKREKAFGYTWKFVND